MRRVLALIGLTVVLVAYPALAQEDTDHLITPGVGIGRIHLGMNLTEVTTILGNPKVTKNMSTSGVAYMWFEYVSFSDGTAESTGGLAVICSPSGEVQQVSAYRDPSYHTQNGLHVGSTESQVLSTMGQPPATTTFKPAVVPKGVHTLIYNGIVFWVKDSNKTVHQISSVKM